jgi:RES domain-containing protein
LKVTAWRITKHKHLNSAFTGEGARLFGGRWNSSGTPMIYVAQSQSLAVLEVLVHLDSAAILEKYVLLRVDFDQSRVTDLKKSELPTSWRADPPPIETQAIGDDWAAAEKSLALRVPSTLVPGESNFLLNPLHPDFKTLKVFKAQSFRFDPRLSERD